MHCTAGRSEITDGERLMDPHGLTADCRCNFDHRHPMSPSKILELLCDHFTEQFGEPPDDQDIGRLEVIAVHFSANGATDVEVVNIQRGSLDEGFRIVS